MPSKSVDYKKEYDSLYEKASFFSQLLKDPIKYKTEYDKNFKGDKKFLHFFIDDFMNEIKKDKDLQEKVKSVLDLPKPVDENELKKSIESKLKESFNKQIKDKEDEMKIKMETETKKIKKEFEDKKIKEETSPYIHSPEKVSTTSTKSLSKSMNQRSLKNFSRILLN